MAEKLSAFWDHFSHHAPNDMLTVIAVGVGLAALAIAVLRLVSTTRGDKKVHSADRQPAQGSETPPWYE